MLFTVMLQLLLLSLILGDGLFSARLFTGTSFPTHVKGKHHVSCFATPYRTSDLWPRIFTPAKRILMDTLDIYVPVRYNICWSKSYHKLAIRRRRYFRKHV